MIKNHLSNGLTYYRVTPGELSLIGGLGICDSCITEPDYGYLVPVLGWYMCPKCFEDWSKRCTHYPEDDWYEELNIRSWERLIPMQTDDDPPELHIWLFNGWDLTDG